MAIEICLIFLKLNVNIIVKLLSKICLLRFHMALPVLLNLTDLPSIKSTLPTGQRLIKFLKVVYENPKVLS